MNHLCEARTTRRNVLIISLLLCDWEKSINFVPTYRQMRINYYIRQYVCGRDSNLFIKCELIEEVHKVVRATNI